MTQLTQSAWLAAMLVASPAWADDDDPAQDEPQRLQLDADFFQALPIARSLPGYGVNFDAIERVAVVTDGMTADRGRATGMIADIQTRSGGDEHHGSAGYWFDTTASARTPSRGESATSLARPSPRLETSTLMG